MKKRSVNIKGHLTSVSLEEEFWDALKRIAEKDALSLNNLITRIDEGRGKNNLSSALRLYVLERLSSSTAP
jgi:predicted DNA-binding ribbon-helix-helix protein